MGFIDWICEPSAELRGQFFDAAYPLVPAPPLTFQCPYCRIALSSKEGLLRHTRTDHPLELPLLLIDGRIARTEEAFRSAVETTALDFQNCTRIEFSIGVDEYREVTKSQLLSTLALQSDSLIRVRITNERSVDQTQAKREHRLIFKIAPLEELKNIETTFISSMKDLPISISAAHTFWNLARDLWSHTASGDYANALANYLIGLAIKQGDPGANHMRFELFKDKLMEALAVLQHIDLPLAHGLTGIIRLNLNEFGYWPNLASVFPDLQAAGAFFHNPGETLAGKRRKPRGAIGPMSKCPVDDLTEWIINVTLMILDGRTSTPSLYSILSPLLSLSPLAEYDRQKIHVLMAAMHLENNCPESAAQHFRSLRADVNFGTWAAKFFER
jgi:hypothetical protein